MRIHTVAAVFFVVACTGDRPDFGRMNNNDGADAGRENSTNDGGDSTSAGGQGGSTAGLSQDGDTSSTDTSSTDTGSTDTGSADTGSADTGSTDTGSADTGSADTGGAGPCTGQCAEDEYCEEDSGDCLPVVCAPDALRCAPGSQQPQACEPDGSAWANEGSECSDSSPFCMDGACVECEPGAVGCVGNVPRSCSEEGVWVNEATCASPLSACRESTGACELGETYRVSVTSAGLEGGASSGTPAISADGRYVAFDSDATMLVSGDTNAVKDVFVHDVRTATTTRVSVSSAGLQGDASSSNPSISADGRYVVFTSSATNLVNADLNSSADVFLHDTKTGSTSRVSLSSTGGQLSGNSQAGSVSADGRFVLFSSFGAAVSDDTNALTDIFVRDVTMGSTSRISLSSAGAEITTGPGMGIGVVVGRQSISADGTRAVFDATSSELVAGDTNTATDVFLRDIAGSATTRVSVSSAGGESNSSSSGPRISVDGRFVLFTSIATNLVSGDSNGAQDVFRHELATGTTIRVNVSSAGAEANGYTYGGSISDDGRYVVFPSSATNLVNGDSNARDDVFLRDVTEGTTSLVLAVADASPVISGDGRFLVFASGATNLVSGDTNGVTDIFVTPTGL